MMIVTPELLSRCCSVKLVIDVKGKLGHLTGEVTKPAAGDPSLPTWRSANSMELDLCYDEQWDCSSDSVRYKKMLENDRVYVFLAGLNRDLDEVRGRILSRKPLPSIREVFSEVRSEEARRNVMLNDVKATREVESSESSALVSKAPEPDGDQRNSKKPLCDFYKRSWHTRETCWKLHGKPPHVKKKQGGAIDHMTGSPSLFSAYKPCAGNQKIKIADGSLSAIAGKGSIIFSSTLTLHNVLHVPNLSCNLLSISKLTLDLNCCANFFQNHCEFQDLTSGKMIGSARQSGGLYFFEEVPSLRRQPPRTCFNSVSAVNNDNEVLLWHFKLGHPSFQYLQYLFPNLFANKSSSSFKCEICELAKHHRASFPSQPYKASKPFSVIHSDVWGPNRISTLTRKRWVITFINDHTRISWVYLMKEKSDVGMIFKTFNNMVQTQFQTKIQVFRTDNGKEYFNKFLGDYFVENGIFHQSSCTDTPQQNGIAERKNKHLLEVARPLLFTTQVPMYLWGKAVLTAAYLIIECLQKFYNFKLHLISLINVSLPQEFQSLPPKIFGCVAFVHIHNQNRGKLAPKARKCIFVGYSPTQKGYRCFDPIFKKMFVTMDVTFFEKRRYYVDNHLQGENRSEDSIFNTIHLETPSISSVLDSLRPEKSLEATIPEPNIVVHVPNTAIPGSTILDPILEHNAPEPQENLTKSNNVNANQPGQPSNVPLEPDLCARQGNKQFEFNVYSRKGTNQRRENPTLQQGHDSNPRSNQTSSSSSNSNSNPSCELNSNSQVFSDLDIPIALRKGTRSCAKYLLSHFVSYHNLSPPFYAFTSQLSSVEIPKNVQDALSVPEWKATILEEMNALEKNQTWKVVNLPKGKSTLGCKWVFTIKYNSDGSLERYKARLVAKGFTQTYGIDYSETFAPVAKLNTVRVLLSIATNLNWPLQQLDVKNAFFNGDLKEEVYMDPPLGFFEKFRSNVCKLQKSLYGLKQSPRAWFEKFTTAVNRQGYRQSQADHTMFTRVSAKGKITVLIVYVDDIILTRDDLVEMDRLKQSLATDFEIKDLGALKYFLGMEVARSKKGIVVSQRKYILDLLKETGISGCKPIDTPMKYNLKLGSVTDRKSTTGYCTFVWEDLRRPIVLPMKLYCDNKAAISIAHNPVQHDRTKHVEIDRHFIKEKLENKIICLLFVPTKQQTSDILTKGLLKTNFGHLVSKLGMIDIYAPT
ncbi:retrovirus-related pol polyprotein from transposon RE1 [Citrus sinensis]|nr:retrovirus-related pol polyprotein from transposon RE1 [Citrus sinensis]